MKRRINVAIVEDDVVAREVLGVELRAQDMLTTLLEDVPEPWRGPRVDVVVLDLILHRDSTMRVVDLAEDTIRRARAAWPFTPIVAWTGLSEVHLHAHWISEHGIDTVVSKPCSGADMWPHILRAHARAEARFSKAAGALANVLSDYFEDDVTDSA